MHPLFLYITLFSFVLTSRGEPRNVTIDDTDPMISYTGNWDASNSHTSALDFNGSHALSSDPFASATLIFTGTAVYFLSPRWPYLVNSTVALDGEGATFVNLTDPEAKGTDGGPESERFTVHWSRTGLDNKTHEVVVSMAAAGQWIVLDGFIFTVNDATDNTASAESSTVPAAASSSLSSSASVFASASTAARSSDNDASGGVNVLAIGLGVSFSVLVTLVCIATCVLCRRRQLRRHNQMSPPLTSAPILYECLPQANISSRPSAPLFVANPDPGSKGSMSDRYIQEKSVQCRVVVEDVMAPPPVYSV